MHSNSWKCKTILRQVVPGSDVIFFILEGQDFNEFVIIFIYYCKLAYVILSEIALS